MSEKYLDAVFAGGCFWCMQGPFDALPGVVQTQAGYMGGHVADPSYEQVCTGTTGHYEVVRIIYNPQLMNFATLLEVFWKNIDPVDDGGQFCDRGPQYRSAVFVNAQEEAMVKDSIAQLEQKKFLPGSIKTAVLPRDIFYPAEEFHQDFYRTNPGHYALYRQGCRRDVRLKVLWGNTP
ncbi:MAG: peptide-methionine (S)-S-oxide reductase MsrA [Desulfomicrobium sp.]|nr:peptide-methionine (S)-S-oxide reductase MsrA [Desulfomicrobium sp.]